MHSKTHVSRSLEGLRQALAWNSCRQVLFISEPQKHRALPMTVSPGLSYKSVVQKTSNLIDSCHPSAGGKACAFQRALLRVGCNASDKTVSSSARSQEGSTAANTAEDKAASLLMALIAAGGLSWFALSSSVSAAEVQDNLPHFHPVAADLGQLAESVSTSPRLFLLSRQASCCQVVLE